MSHCETTCKKNRCKAFKQKQHFKQATHRSGEVTHAPRRGSGSCVLAGEQVTCPGPEVTWLRAVIKATTRPPRCIAVLTATTHTSSSTGSQTAESCFSLLCFSYLQVVEMRRFFTTLFFLLFHDKPVFVSATTPGGGGWVGSWSVVMLCKRPDVHTAN